MDLGDLASLIMIVEVDINEFSLSLGLNWISE